MKKILIIDDDPNIVQLMQSRIQANGYDCLAASDGEEGLAAFQSYSPDLIIVDVLMPKMDGYTFVRTLNQKFSAIKIPIIVVTAKDKMKDLFELEGVCDYVIKPYHSDDLIERIKKRLGQA